MFWNDCIYPYIDKLYLKRLLQFTSYLNEICYTWFLGTVDEHNLFFVRPCPGHSVIMTELQFFSHFANFNWTCRSSFWHVCVLRIAVNHGELDCLMTHLNGCGRLCTITTKVHVKFVLSSLKLYASKRYGFLQH